MTRFLADFIERSVRKQPERWRRQVANSQRGRECPKTSNVLFKNIAF